MYSKELYSSYFLLHFELHNSTEMQLKKVIKVLFSTEDSHVSTEGSHYLRQTIGGIYRQIMVEAIFWASICAYIELQAGSLMSGHNLKWARGMFLMVCNSSHGFAFQVKLLEGPSEVIIPQLKKKYEVDTLDFVFVDHWKDRYAPDTILLQVSSHNSSLKSKVPNA